MCEYSNSKHEIGDSVPAACVKETRFGVPPRGVALLLPDSPSVEIGCSVLKICTEDTVEGPDCASTVVPPVEDPPRRTAWKAVFPVGVNTQPEGTVCRTGEEGTADASTGDPSGLELVCIVPTELSEVNWSSSAEKYERRSSVAVGEVAGDLAVTGMRRKLCALCTYGGTSRLPAGLLKALPDMLRSALWGSPSMPGYWPCKEGVRVAGTAEDSE